MSARVDSSDAVHYEIFCKKHAPYRKRENEEMSSRYTIHRAHAVNASVNIRSEGSDIEELSCMDSPIVLLSSPFDGLQDTTEKTRGRGGFGRRTQRKR
jgi:hypothetical protein